VVTIVEVDTPHGPAHARLELVDGARGALVLGHGAGGGVQAPDLQTAASAAGELGISVALVEQPYRVAGRRSPAPAAQLDTAWTAVLARLRADELAGVQFVTGGRSAGARVACRTAEATRAVAVLCLAFPLVWPSRGDKPPQSRLPELEAVTVPVLVVQGENDRFGIPPPGPSREVVTVAGDHGLKKDREAIAEAVRSWLGRVLPG
jgi:uncharacterized protein